MSLKTRRIIAFIFIASFFITAPILILYTAGYRYSMKKNQLKKTGALFLETEPKNANIYINDEIQKNQTPAHLTNIFPNHHKIRIEKQGYYNWKKELEIKTQHTTFAENIELFKKSDPALISTNFEISKIWQAKNCFLTKGSLNNTIKFSCIKPPNEISEIADFEADSIKLIGQSPEKNKFLIQDQNNEYKIISAGNSYRKTLSDLPATPEITKWDKQNEHFIYFSEDKGIWQINLLGRKPVYSQILKTENEKIIDFAAKGENLYIIFSNKKGTFLDLTSIQNPLEKKQSIQLTSSKFIIDSIIDDYLIIFDKSKSDIYVLSDNLQKTKIKVEGSDKFAYLKEKNLMIIYNDFEIFLVNLNDEIPQANLIIRYSTKIEKIEWFDDNYLIMLHENRLKIIELDNRNKRNISELNKNLNVDDFFLDEKKENIYCLAENKFWKLNIK